MISHRSIMAAAGAAVRDSLDVLNYCVTHFGKGLAVHVGAYAQGVPGVEDSPFLWIIPQEENEDVNEDEVFTVRMTVGGAVKGSGGEKVITTAANHQEIVVGQATPAAPAFSTNTPMALPITFNRFIAPETYIVVRVLPMERYSAAPAL